MNRLHPLLARQLSRLDVGSEPPSLEQWTKLLERVSRAYQESDQDRYLLERSQDLASAEMAELYAALEAEKAQLESRVGELPKNTLIVVTCMTGFRSEPAREFLKQQGFERVEMARFDEYLAKGHPTVPLEHPAQ